MKKNGILVVAALIMLANSVVGASRFRNLRSAFIRSSNPKHDRRSAIESEEQHTTGAAGSATTKHDNVDSDLSVWNRTWPLLIPSAGFIIGWRISLSWPGMFRLLTGLLAFAIVIGWSSWSASRRYCDVEDYLKEESKNIFIWTLFFAVYAILTNA